MSHCFHQAIDTQWKRAACPLKILYIGQLADGQTCRMRMEALLEQGHEMCARSIRRKPGTNPHGYRDTCKNASLQARSLTGLTKRSCKDHQNPECLAQFEFQRPGLSDKPQIYAMVRQAGVWADLPHADGSLARTGA